MKTTNKLIKFFFLTYFKSTKFVMPFVAILLFLYTCYATAPVAIVESYTVSLVVVFLIMIWVGLSANTLIDPVAEQLLVLKCRSMLKYNLSKALFLFLLGILVSVLMTLFPVVQNVINGFHLYLRDLTAADVGAALLLHILAAFTGGAVGALMHQRIIKDRRLALVITFGIAALAVAKTSINETYAAARFVTWLLPPIADMVKNLAADSYFTLRAVSSSAILLLLYGTILSGAQIFLLNRNKF